MKVAGKLFHFKSSFCSRENQCRISDIQLWRRHQTPKHKRNTFYWITWEANTVYMILQKQKFYPNVLQKLRPEKNRPYHFKFFKGCLQQILLGPFLNILARTGSSHWERFLTPCSSFFGCFFLSGIGFYFSFKFYLKTKYYASKKCYTRVVICKD